MKLPSLLSLLSRKSTVNKCQKYNTDQKSEEKSYSRYTRMSGIAVWKLRDETWFLRWRGIVLCLGNVIFVVVVVVVVVFVVAAMMDNAKNNNKFTRQREENEWEEMFAFFYREKQFLCFSSPVSLDIDWQRQRGWHTRRRHTSSRLCLSLSLSHENRDDCDRRNRGCII